MLGVFPSRALVGVPRYRGSCPGSRGVRPRGFRLQAPGSDSSRTRFTGRAPVSGPSVGLWTRRGAPFRRRGPGPRVEVPEEHLAVEREDLGQVLPEYDVPCAPRLGSRRRSPPRGSGSPASQGPYSASWRGPRPLSHCPTGGRGSRTTKCHWECYLPVSLSVPYPHGTPGTTSGTGLEAEVDPSRVGLCARVCQQVGRRDSETSVVSASVHTHVRPCVYVRLKV